MSELSVVSLVPSVTESLLAWGVQPVACTRFCEQPTLRTVGGTKNPDIEAIAALRPDLVVLDREENRREDHDALVERGLAVHVTHVRDLVDVDPEMALLAEAVGTSWEPLPVDLRTALRATIESDDAPTAARPGPPPRRVAVPIWRRPWMWLGEPTYGSSLLAALDMVNVLADEALPYPEADLSAVAALRPERLVVPDEPYAFDERHRAELETVAPAVFIDGKDLVWWGERTRTALPRLAAVLNDSGLPQ